MKLMSAQNKETTGFTKKETKLARFGCLLIGIILISGPFSPLVYEHQLEEIIGLSIFGQLIALFFAICCMSVGVTFLFVAYKGYLPLKIAKHIN